ncbi:MAG TPA: hypothetical protein H9717_02170 [Candidatus Eisenbergiella merdipullorum]|uniref:Uncharacterized protein n=1 Tax=Candidatus Eisenbergiella merdipullorum TaxID=2838553 RepID=A0A9D2KZ31_9FIRM|nr:hypothetical protein [Candidatus Eisenbergiella merdipullorum]
MLGKIIDGKLTYPPHRIVLDGMQIFNPTEAQLLSAGYKTITETAMPEELAPEGQHYEATYADAGDAIMQGWELVENQASETEKTLDERVTALEQNQGALESAIEQALTP